MNEQPLDTSAARPPLNFQESSFNQPSVTQEDFKRHDVQKEQAVKEREELAAKTTVGDVYKAAWENTVTKMLWDNAKEFTSGRFDPDFVLTEDKFREYTKDIDSKYWGEFDSIHSEKHAMQIRERIKNQEEMQKILTARGVAPAIAASLITAIADPVPTAVGLLSGGVLAPVAFGTRATRVGNMLRGGVVAAGTAAPLEAYQASRDINYDTDDAIIGTLIGGALGTVAGAFSPVSHQLNTAYMKAINEVDLQAAQRAGYQAGERAEAFLPGSTKDGKLRTSEDKIAEALSGNHAGTAMGAIRVDRAATNFTSDNMELRALSHKFFADPNPEKGSYQAETATEYATLLSDNFVRDRVMLHRENLQNFMREAKNAGITADKDMFETEIWRALNGKPSRFEAVNKMAEHDRKAYEKIAKLAQGTDRNGVPVKGSENMTIKDYVTRQYSTSKIAAAIQKAGGGEAGRRAVAKQIGAAIRGYEPKVAEEIGLRIVELTQRMRGGRVDFRGLQGNVETMAGYLQRELGMEYKEAIKFTNGLKELIHGKDAGNATNLKFRLDLDDLALEDFLETDAGVLYNQYTRSMSGHIALARQGFASEDEVLRAIEEVEKRYADLPKHNPKKARRELDNLRDALNATLGRTVGSDPTTTTATTMRMLRKFNFARVMNLMGISALGDIGVTVGQVGLSVALRSIPSMKTLFGQVKDGKFADQLTQDMAIATGWGKRHWAAEVHSRIERVGINGEVQQTGINKLENALDSAGRITSYISGMNIVQETTHHFAAASMMQTFADAFRTGKPHRLGKARLAEMGINDEVYSRIREEFMKKGNASWDSSGRLTRVNWDNWDSEVALSMHLAMRRWGGYLSQEQNFGSLPQFADSTLGKVMLQFRSFVMGAWVKQSLYNIKHADYVAATTTMAALVSATLSYAVYAGQRFVGLPEDKRQDEYNRLFDPQGTGEVDTAHVFNQVLMRTGPASVLPVVADTILSQLGFEEAFGSRTSGLSAGITSNPTLDLLQKSQEFVKNASNDIRQGELTSNTVTSAARLAVWQNAIGIGNGIKALASEFPESEYETNKR